MKKQILSPRSDVPVEETWNLESIFPNTEAWDTARKEVLETIPDLAKYKGRLNESPAILGDFFDLFQQTFRRALLVMVYGSLGSAVDTTDQQAQARAGQGQSVMVRFNATTAFVNPELMAIGFNTLGDWTEKDDRLSYLGHFIDELEREKQHIRGDEVEQVLALSGEPLGDFFRAYSAVTNADLQFDEAIDSEGEVHEVGQSSIGALLTHKDRQVRETAFESYSNGYLSFKNTLANLQLGGLHRDIFYARNRNYGSSLEASLGSNNIPTDVFYALIDTFKKNLPIWHRYWQVRKKALGYENLHVYDIKAPLQQETPVIPFKQAVEWICEALAPLGEAYTETIRKGATEDRWVDRARNRGKRQGAFSSGVYDTNPFIMMSYANDVFSMSTLAHELGHSMHSYLTRHTQPFVYSHYSLFVAEVASNFHQAMLRDYLFTKLKDPKYQLALIEEAMSNFHRYFFIMPTLARWELEVHERAEHGKPLTADIMSDICCNYFAEGYGDEVTYDKSQIGITWAQFQHMYMNFYVYQYATGISAANALAKGVLEGSQENVKRYLDFLKAGSSLYPLDALKLAGVDMTSSKAVDDAFMVMGNYVDRLEALVKAGEV